MSMRYGIAREMPFGAAHETVSETKRASAAQSLEAAIAIGARLYKRTGSDEDAAGLALVVRAHEAVTGSRLGSMKILADPAAATSAEFKAIAHRALAFLDD